MTAFLGALLAALVLTGVAIPVLRRAQFMDVPNHRSSHTLPVPRGGGVAVVFTICAVAATLGQLSTQLVVLLVVAALMGAVGLIDDLRSLPSGVRLGAQIVAALALATSFLAAGTVSWWWLPVLAIAIAGYVNAYNFMDGINGISGLAAAMVGGWWAWAGHDQGHELLHVLGLVLAGAALGFLPWNAPRARVFLGDVGSYGIGVFIVGLSALALTSGFPWLWALAPLVIYGADTGWVLIKRYRGRRPLTEAHREHVYQRLVDGGWSHTSSAVLCIGAAALVCALVGLAGQDFAWWSVLALCLATLTYLISPVLLLSKENA